MVKTKNPVEILSEEHQVILHVINALAEECYAIKNSKKEIDEIFFTSTIDFVRNYADKFHHAKEEDIFFVEFCNNAHLAHCNPVEQMLYEHKLGRDFIKNLEDAVKGKNKNEIVKNGLGYAALLEEHIYKEDNILYPMADEVLSGETQKTMLEKFAEAEKKKFKNNEIKKYVKFSKDISKKIKRANKKI